MSVFSPKQFAQTLSELPPMPVAGVNVLPPEVRHPYFGLANDVICFLSLIAERCGDGTFAGTLEIAWWARECGQLRELVGKSYDPISQAELNKFTNIIKVFCEQPMITAAGDRFAISCECERFFRWRVLRADERDVFYGNGESVTLLNEKEKARRRMKRYEKKSAAGFFEISHSVSLLSKTVKKEKQ